jgi:hypothetical protein
MKNFRYEIWVNESAELPCWKLLRGGYGIWESREAAIAQAEAIAPGYADAVVESFAISTGTYQGTIWSKTA